MKCFTVNAARAFGVAMMVAAIFALSGCGKTYSRSEFNQMVMHKTEDQVRSVLGEPSYVSDGKPLTWMYYRKTFNAGNQNKEDYRAVLKFSTDGASHQHTVTDVEYDDKSST